VVCGRLRQRADAEAAGLPLRTLADVQACLSRDKARSRKGKRIDITMARLMLNHGRLTADARAWIESEYPQG
jgi:hypothetical protein